MKEGGRGMRRASSVKEEARARLQVVEIEAETSSVMLLLSSRLSAGGASLEKLLVAPKRERGKVVAMVGAVRRALASIVRPAEAATRRPGVSLAVRGRRFGLVDVGRLIDGLIKSQSHLPPTNQNKPKPQVRA